VHVSAAVGLAGVYDLVSSAERGLDELSTIALMGGLPSQEPDSYARASPAALLPIGVDQLIVVGVNDRPDLVDDNRRYVQNAQAAGDSVELMELPEADHFTVIDPASLTWLAIAERLLSRFPPALSAREDRAPRSGVKGQKI
jgi:pimeloyl-ACP methyl ester carboxylesterase